MTLLAIREFLLILGLGLVVAGVTTYIITWMLVAVHVREHHPDLHARLRGFMFAPAAFGWYLSGGWRSARDPGLGALAVLGSIGAWTILLGGSLTIISKVIAFTASAR